MTDLLLFQCNCAASADEGFLGNEWLASAVGIAITYIVFVMGIPALLFQTFIPEAFRNIYNERFNAKWSRFFLTQLGVIAMIFLLSDPKVYKMGAGLLTSLISSDLPAAPPPPFGLSVVELSEGIIALFIFGIIVYVILYKGYRHLIDNFKSTRNIAQHLSEKIANGAIKGFDRSGTLHDKDIEDLNVLAKELKAGQVKTQFLEQCERIIEHILDAPHSPENSKLIKRLLEEAVCLSITYEGAQANQENRRKVLQILTLVHGHSPQQKPEPKTWWRRWIKKVKSFFAGKTGEAYFPISYDAKREDEYRKTIIGYFTKEVGIAAIQKSDFESVGEAIEQLYTIDADPNELFSLGSRANDLGDTSSTVAVHKKLTSKIRKAFREERDLSKEELRTIYFWLGLLARIHQKGGSARVFAGRQWESMEELLSQENRSAQPRTVFDATYKHFYRLTDFVTADAVKKLEKILFP